MSKNLGGRSDAAEKAKERANWDFEDKVYVRDDWKIEVACGDTQLGYFDWVIHKIEAEIESGEV
jgi:hypothetical protein